MDEFLCQNKCCILIAEPYVHINDPSEKFRRRRNKAGVFLYDPASYKVLLVQSRGRLWGPPKGTLEPGETPAECAIREVLEETGVRLSVSDLKCSTNIKDRAIYYYVEIKETDVNIQMTKGNDANGIGWVNIDCVRLLIQRGNISITQHMRILSNHFLNKSLPYSDYTLVKNHKNKARGKVQVGLLGQ